MATVLNSAKALDGWADVKAQRTPQVWNYTRNVVHAALAISLEGPWKPLEF